MERAKIEEWWGSPKLRKRFPAGLAKLFIELGVTYFTVLLLKLMASAAGHVDILPTIPLATPEIQIGETIGFGLIFNAVFCEFIRCPSDDPGQEDS